MAEFNVDCSHCNNHVRITYHGDIAVTNGRTYVVKCRECQEVVREIYAPERPTVIGGYIDD